MLAHVDADSFFASVLVRKHPRLRGKPLLALGMGGGGFVIAASYEAKAFGVKTGMRLTDALKLVPDAIQMPSDFRETGLASDQIEEILRDSCPVVEQMSVDEWYLDLRTLVGGVPVDSETWAKDLRTKILDHTGLSVSIGVGPSKLLSKMAGEYRKPGGITVIEDPKEFLTDRPAAAVPGIGHRRMVHAERLKWMTAWDFANADTDVVVQLFGRPGRDMQRELLGEQLSPVTTERADPQSISRCRSFRHERNVQTIFAHVLRHLEYCVLKMRRFDLACHGVAVWLRDGDYRHRISHKRLPQAFATEEDIVPHVRQCMRRIYERDQTCTQTGLALWQLVPQGVTQYSLFELPEYALKNEMVQRALDTIHQRFGRDSIMRGAAMRVRSGTGREFGVPILE